MVTLPACLPPESGIIHQESQTEAYVNEKNCGTGTLFIAEREVCWVNSNVSGFKLSYPSISIHAVSRDTSNFPHECLYMILDVKLADWEEQPMNDEEGSDEDSTSGSTEVRFVPAQRDNLDAMYQAMCACQELHPDPEQDDSDDEYFGEECLIGEGDGPQLSTEGISNLARMEQMLANGVNGGDGENGSNGRAQEEMEEEEEDQFEDA